ncbi:MAG: excinuclease ABC subunit UvrA, partial [Lachnospiraceae bacterium]|nr:excinuclease ABC subunit UvrA [Lachnospiraceae bacterium]
MDRILIKNAHFHNLKNIDIEIPKNKVVTVAGVSGSGKTTIVYDILYQKSVMRYLRYRDMISDNLEEDTCDDIVGLGPVIAVRQDMIRQANPKSVIGTKTNMLDDLKRLYLLEGQIPCPACGNMIGNASICPICGASVTMVHERQLSFNSPEGMCLECRGRGHKTEIHMENII